jgi:hypothetical protein
MLSVHERMVIDITLWHDVIISTSNGGEVTIAYIDTWKPIRNISLQFPASYVVLHQGILYVGLCNWGVFAVNVATKEISRMIAKHEHAIVALSILKGLLVWQFQPHQ